MNNRPARNSIGGTVASMGSTFRRPPYPIICTNVTRLRYFLK